MEFAKRLKSLLPHRNHNHQVSVELSSIYYN
ncbi:hypothetical protein FHR87_003626 [Azomonas macrocytogenes]|uniref:Uncharacterized protein n=1 Tax=Azomonas macrocytogenes TaxID=69962 RepID=A0A839T6T2_AZOMA|nr:hypothetical protein [Azomonas macrocytogenes]